MLMQDLPLHDELHEPLREFMAVTNVLDTSKKNGHSQTKRALLSALQQAFLP
jgi:hypothetical protein